MKGEIALAMMIALTTANPFQDDRRYSADNYRYRRNNGKHIIERRTRSFGVSGWETVTDANGDTIYIDSEWDANKIVRKLNSREED